MLSFYKNYICLAMHYTKPIFMRKLLPLIIVSFLFSCGQRTKQSIKRDIPHSVVYTTPAGDKIIFLEDYYNVYLNAIKKDYANRNTVYQEDIQDTIFKEYFSQSEYAPLIKSALSSPIRDTVGLRDFISSISKNHEKIEAICTTALAECRKYLKNDSITIYIMPSTHDMFMKIEGMGGISGITAGSKQIVLTVEPAVYKWAEMLPYNVAHEYNHTYWTKMNFTKSSHNLLDYLVFEGRADSYAHLIYPDIECSWTKPLPEDVESQLWNRIKPQLNDTDIAFQYGVMFGSGSQYPYWGGYKLGYRIVQSALKNHPGLSPVEWTNLPSEKILEMSDYKR